MLKGFKRYVLTEKSKATKSPVWVLRKAPLVETKQGLKRIRYVRGAHTIKDEDLDEKLKTTTVEFTDGTLTIPLSDKILIKYVESHPEYNVNYKLLDPEGDAEEALRKEDLIDEAKAKLRKLNEVERAAVAAIIFGDSATRGLKDNSIRLKLNEYIKDVETKVDKEKTKPEYFVEVLGEPLTEAKFLVIQAIRQNVIEVSTDKTSVRWTKDKGVIVPVASGESPVNKLAEFIMSKKGGNTIQELSERLSGKQH